MFFSNCLVRGPVVIHPDLRAAVTSAMILSSILGGEKGIMLANLLDRNVSECSKLII